MRACNIPRPRKSPAPAAGKTCPPFRAKNFPHGATLFRLRLKGGTLTLIRHRNGDNVQRRRLWYTIGLPLAYPSIGQGGSLPKLGRNEGQRVHRLRWTAQHGEAHRLPFLAFLILPPSLILNFSERSQQKEVNITFILLTCRKMEKPKSYG